MRAHVARPPALIRHDAQRGGQPAVWGEAIHMRLLIRPTVTGESIERLYSRLLP